MILVDIDLFHSQIQSNSLSNNIVLIGTNIFLFNIDVNCICSQRHLSSPPRDTSWIWYMSPAHCWPTTPRRVWPTWSCELFSLRLTEELTLRKIAIWLSKNCQKLDFFSKKIAKNFHFFPKKLKKRQILAIFFF